MKSIPTYQRLNKAIDDCREHLKLYGVKKENPSWQSKKIDVPMIEVYGISFRCIIEGIDLDQLKRDVKPNLPWVDKHFRERISGIPYNPPPSHTEWPWRQKDNDAFISNSEFSHTYPERMWPKYAGFTLDIAEKHPDIIRDGIRYDYGDLNDVINLLDSDPGTRQAFLPIWFPEDTGAVHGGRVPCSLGYLFEIRENKLHVTYYIRSCDYVRHFRDDIYLAIRLGKWVRDQLISIPTILGMGVFTMHIANLHCFESDLPVIDKY